MANKKPVFSVIIPCYNCLRYIDETLQSLERQTYRDFEVICVDDGSTDQTLARLNKWAQKGTLALRVINQPNGGVSRARNRGIDAVQGEYVLFLDADDVFHPDYLARMAWAAEESQADTVYCRLTRNLSRLSEVQGQRRYALHTQRQVMENLMLRMDIYGFYCYAYRTEILRQHNIRFTEGRSHFEDREFNWKYLCHCENAAWLDMPLYGYRISEGSAMGKEICLERVQNAINAVKELENYLEEHNCAFSDAFNNYMYYRVMWGMAKRCAEGRKRDLFRRMCREYDMKQCMKKMCRNHNKLVLLGSRLFLVHPDLFYYSIAVVAGAIK